MVPGKGPKDAKIVFVGEAPGVDEERLGEPFIGASGNLLNDMLAKAGIDRNACYLTNVMKIRPPNNDFGVFYVDRNRIQPTPQLLDGITYLYKEIRSIRPNVICTLGSEALRAVTNRRNISSWRGSILSSPLGKVVPTYHPAYILRMYGDRPVTELDLRRVAREANSPNIVQQQFLFEINPQFSRVLEFLRTRPPRISVDIESTRNMVRCIGIADSPTHAICIPFIAKPYEIKPGDVTLFLEQSAGSSAPTNSRWSHDEEYAILSEMDKLFRDPSVQKVFQNFPYDSTVLSQEFGFEFRNYYLDTLNAQHTSYPELPKALDFQASIHTRIPYWSGYDVTSDTETWTYNCYDCCATYELSQVHEKAMASLGVDEFYFSHVHPSISSFTRGQNRGILIDQDLRSKLASEAEARIEDAKAQIKTLTGSDLNPNSSKQMQEFFCGTLKLQVTPKKDPKTKEYKISMDEETLLKLKKKYPQHSSIIDFCLTYRENVKMIATFLKGDLHNGRFYTSFNLSGTQTGRISASTPIIYDGKGGNIQQVHRGELRRIFISDPGWSLIKSDLSQADFRVVMWIARVSKLIERLNDPSFDIHRWNAAHNIFRCEESQVTKDMRTRAKASVHGSNYGMGPDKSAKLYSLTFKEAQELQELYHAAIPEIRGVYWPEIQAQLMASRVLTTPLGRRRLFMGRWGDDLFRQAYAFQPQAVVGDIINRAYTLGDELFDENECHPLLQVHDEIVWHCRDDRIDTYVPKIRRLMEYPIKFPNVEIPLVIPVEISVGKNWFDQKAI